MIYSKKKALSGILSETDIKEDEQDRDKQQLFGFTLTTKIEETRVKTCNQSTVLPNIVKYIKTRLLCVSTLTARLTHLSKEARKVRTPRAHSKSTASKLDFVQATQKILLLFLFISFLSIVILQHCLR